MNRKSHKRKSTIVIEAGKNRKLYWLDLLNSWEILFFLVWRDLLVRYKQTAIGILWGIIQPALNMMLFVFIFSYIAKLPSASNTPYALMVFTGLLPWQFFSNSINQSSTSFINNTNLVSKIYFPRIILPLSSIIACIVDFIISLFLLFILMIYYHFMPNVKILLTPLFIIHCFFLISGISFFVSSINVKYRDFRILVPFALQVGFFISSVGYSSHIVPAKYRLLFSLNPMVGIIDGFRWCIIGDPLYIPGLIASLATTGVIFMAGYGIFKKIEHSIADFI